MKKFCFSFIISFSKTMRRCKKTNLLQPTQQHLLQQFVPPLLELVQLPLLLQLGVQLPQWQQLVLPLKKKIRKRKGMKLLDLDE